MSEDGEPLAAREAAIRAMLPYVPLEGWTARALRHGLEDLGIAPDAGRSLFPTGTIGLIGAWRELLDREMEAASVDLPEIGMGKRVRALVVLRLRLLRPHREAARRALAALVRSGGAEPIRFAGRTADAIWHAAGDKAADFSWYTKRASLAAIYTATLLYWLRDETEDDGPSLAFLDRRLAGIARIGRLRRRFGRRPRRASPGRRESG